MLNSLFNKHRFVSKFRTYYEDLTEFFESVEYKLAPQQYQFSR